MSERIIADKKERLKNMNNMNKKNNEVTTNYIVLKPDTNGAYLLKEKVEYIIQNVNDNFSKASIDNLMYIIDKKTLDLLIIDPKLMDDIKPESDMQIELINRMYIKAINMNDTSKTKDCDFEGNILSLSLRTKLLFDMMYNEATHSTNNYIQISSNNNQYIYIISKSRDLVISIDYITNRYVNIRSNLDGGKLHNLTAVTNALEEFSVELNIIKNINLCGCIFNASFKMSDFDGEVIQTLNYIQESRSDDRICLNTLTIIYDEFHGVYIRDSHTREELYIQYIDSIYTPADVYMNYYNYANTNNFTEFMNRLGKSINDKLINDESINDVFNTHPEHYQKGIVEPIDYIKGLGLNFNLGNAIKYISRCDFKGNKTEYLLKAIYYIEREIEHDENK